MHDPRPAFPFRLLACLLLLLVATTGSAQGLKLVAPDKFERATTTDEQGLLQWAPFAEEKCPTCEGAKETVCQHCARFDDNKKCPECAMKKKAVCRGCGGLGHWPDPLEKASCPGCQGAGVLPCFVCGGRGVQKVTGSGDKLFDCVGCKGDGGQKCGVCNGARLVEVAAVKPSLKDAPVAALKKALAAVDDVLDDIGKFEPGKDARKSVKEYVKHLGPIASVLPPMKRAPKVLEDWMGKNYAGSVFEGSQEREASAIRFFKGNNEYYLKHQKRMLELALQRAEHNAKVLADKKDGKKEE